MKKVKRKTKKEESVKKKIKQGHEKDERIKMTEYVRTANEAR